MKMIDLARLHEESQELREAVAFYANFGIRPFVCSTDERERHYKTLEDGGYLEKVRYHETH